jgi:hypothetical protein
VIWTDTFSDSEPTEHQVHMHHRHKSTIFDLKLQVTSRVSSSAMKQKMKLHCKESYCIDITKVKSTALIHAVAFLCSQTAVESKPPGHAQGRHWPAHQSRLPVSRLTHTSCFLPPSLHNPYGKAAEALNRSQQLCFF